MFFRTSNIFRTRERQSRSLLSSRRMKCRIVLIRVQRKIVYVTMDIFKDMKKRRKNMKLEGTLKNSGRLVFYFVQKAGN